MQKSPISFTYPEISTNRSKAHEAIMINVNYSFTALGSYISPIDNLDTLDSFAVDQQNVAARIKMPTKNVCAILRELLKKEGGDLSYYTEKDFTDILAYPLAQVYPESIPEFEMLLAKLHTDACRKGIAGSLYRAADDGKEHTILFISRGSRGNEVLGDGIGVSRNGVVPEQVGTLRRLIGTEIYTNHAALKWSGTSKVR